MLERVQRCKTKYIATLMITPHHINLDYTTASDVATYVYVHMNLTT